MPENRAGEAPPARFPGQGAMGLTISEQFLNLADEAIE
jgi:hypothetical protein